MVIYGNLENHGLYKTHGIQSICDRFEKLVVKVRSCPLNVVLMSDDDDDGVFLSINTDIHKSYPGTLQKWISPCRFFKEKCSL